MVDGEPQDQEEGPRPRVRRRVEVPAVQVAPQGWGKPPRWAIAVMAIVSALVVYGVWAMPLRAAPPYHPRPAATTAKERTAVFLGDSYTLGSGADPQANRWTTLVAHREGWREINVGVFGTGYVNAGPDNAGSYLARVPKVIADHPDIVVVSGGQNDASAPTSQVAAAIQQTYEALHAGLPNARIIAVGPSVPNVAVIDPIRIMDANVQAAAKSIGGTYISLLTPPVLNSPTMISADKQHPNNAGYSAIADRVVLGIPG